jgi:hypothetical protein
MKNYIYTVEELAKTFAEHHKKVIEEREIEIQKFITHYPDSEIPESLKDDFSIAKALQAICEEISRLRKGVIQYEWDEKK